MVAGSPANGPKAKAPQFPMDCGACFSDGRPGYRLQMTLKSQYWQLSGSVHCRNGTRGS